MPHLCLLFDDATDSSMRGTASAIASQSAFTPATVPLHVPLIGSLHSYSEADVKRSLEKPLPSITGRFVKWEISRKDLRVVVELADADSIMQHLLTDLPAGRPWRSLYVVLGSVKSIDVQHHQEFLAALQTAYPIDGSTTFTCAQPRLEYHNVPPPMLLPKQAQPTSGQAVPPVAKTTGGSRRRRQKRPPQKQQPQKQQPQVAVSLMSNQQRKTTSALLQTGNVIRKKALRQACSSQATLRAVAVQKARERGIERAKAQSKAAAPSTQGAAAAVW